MLERLHFATIHNSQVNGFVNLNPVQSSPDRSVVREYASGAVGRGLQLCHTKGDKNGTGSFLADALNKRVVPGRYKNAAKNLLRIFVMLQ